MGTYNLKGIVKSTYNLPRGLRGLRWLIVIIGVIRALNLQVGVRV